MGYARVSTADQSMDMQVERILNYGVLDRDLFCDEISAVAKRPAFNLLKKQLWPGDTLVVYSLSRLHRDAREQLNFFKWCEEQHIKIVSLTENVDMSKSHGKTMAGILAVMDEAERMRIRDRTADGMQTRIRQGQMMGRPVKLTPSVITEIKSMRRRGFEVSTIARKTEVSKSAVYQALKS